MSYLVSLLGEKSSALFAIKNDNLLDLYLGTLNVYSLFKSFHICNLQMTEQYILVAKSE